MRIAAKYSFNRGEAVVTRRYPHLLVDVNAAIKSVNATRHKTKESREKTMPGRMLYSPRTLNAAFKDYLLPKGWNTVRVQCDYSTDHYEPDYRQRMALQGAFREMDFVKEKLGSRSTIRKIRFHGL